MHIKALETLFIRDQERHVAPGETVEIDDAKAKLLIDRGAAESMTAREAAKLSKEQEAS